MIWIPMMKMIGKIIDLVLLGFTHDRAPLPYPFAIPRTSYSLRAKLNMESAYGL